MVEAPASILVYVGLDAVGDGLMKLPFVRALRAAFPAARITWMAGKGHTVYAGVLGPVVAGLVDEVIDDAHVGSRLRELVGRRPLDGRAFDLVIDTQRRLLTTLILRRIRHRRFLSAAAGFRLSDLRPAAGRVRPPAMVGQLLALAELAAGGAVTAAAALPRDAAAEALADGLLPPGPTYVGFAPGAGGRHKCWPLERYLELAAAEAGQGRVPVFFLGPAEADWAPAVRRAVPHAVLPLQGGHAATPMLTIALARRLALAVANDSGAGHMLAAADIPLVSLFGPTPPEKFAPAARRLAVIRAQAWGGEAMELIPVDAVAAAMAGFQAEHAPVPALL
ncbi:glycosyltransferase family 9 protein [Magnetospirillum sp. UT-4]|uniref:glycosyltransferase family 9 protein n=1 Tax=Magnetospirillum sp. UT-4 TaxID=2681467 RepID=UPI001385AF3B|nr:glycosyltransferase family 9 protein [Magnetospirillum sp. UT-4]CAA7614239.1 Heptosyltransferase family protein [Magnetospirillum sp. UT-4]